ncbi:14567_t:CDS:2, partial [Racocetra fulgida]
MTGLIGQLTNVQKRLAVPYRDRKSWLTAKLMNLNNAFTSQARFQTTIEDPTYKGLFYHSTHEAVNYSLSFISDRNKVEKYDISVIGWVPFQTGVPKLLVGNFKENKNFIKFLHQVIADNVADADPQLQALAKYQQNGQLREQDSYNIADNVSQTNEEDHQHNSAMASEFNAKISTTQEVQCHNQNIIPKTLPLRSEKSLSEAIYSLYE